MEIHVLKKKELVIIVVLGIPGGGKDSQELELMSQFSVTENTSHRQQLEFIHSPWAPAGEEPRRGGPEPGSFSHSTQG